MKIKNFIHSLYFKIIGSITLILIISGLINYLIIQETTRKKIESIEHQITSNFSSALGKSILDQMLFSDPSIFQGLLNSLIEDGTITFAFIIDEKEELVVHTFSPIIPEDIVNEVIKSKNNRVIESNAYGSNYITIEPLFNGILGYMVLGQKLPDLTPLWLKTGIITIISFIIINCIIALTITRSFTDPLYSLISSINITDSYGIPTGSIRNYRTTEFNKLSTTINSMISSISRSRDDLKSTHIRLKSIFDYSLQIAIIGSDKDGYIKLFNAGAEKMLGFTKEEVVDIKSPLDIHLKSELEEKGKELSKKFDKRIRGFDIFRLSILGKDYDEGEWTYIKKNGEHLTVNLILSALKDEEGEIIGIVGFAQDITERKRDEEELREHREHLQTLVESRTTELQDSLDRLKLAQNQLVEAEKMASLGSLVAGIAHEINTPVGIGVTAASYLDNKTKQFSEIYKSGELTKSKFEDFIETAQESSQMILANMQRAASLINSFKKVAVDQSSEEIRTFVLCEYIDEILLSLNSKFKNTNYRINVQCPKEITLTSYPGAISQILTNLLMNSLIHGFEGVDSGEIKIDISERMGEIQLIYKDTGIGIKSEHIAKIFDPFFTTKRGQGGSGLGMNILYNLVTQTLEGSVSCESEEGMGTKFIISFPGKKIKSSIEEFCSS